MSEEPQYIEGQRFVCPKCKLRSVVKIKHEIKDFKVVSSYPICAFCHARLDTMGTPAKKLVVPSTARQALDKLFGDDSPEEQARLKQEKQMKASLSAVETHFCRDCRHYIHHPFLSRCELHHRSVEPMDDCGDFTALTSRES